MDYGIAIAVIVLILVVYILLLISSVKRKSEKLPTIWLWSYTYIRMPVTILSLLGAIQLTENGVSPLVIIIFVGLIILYTINFLGLIRRTWWVYNLNWWVLIIECFVFPFVHLHSYIITPIVYVIFVGIGGFFWLLPNVIYFSKREFLFVKINKTLMRQCSICNANKPIQETETIDSGEDVCLDCLEQIRK